MSRERLIYAQTILSKVSFDHQLFEREFEKAMLHLPAQQVRELRDWCTEHFPQFKELVIESYLGIEASSSPDKLHNPLKSIRFDISSRVYSV